ncbi:MAG: FAD-dependent oxidoreductase [Thermoplasmata archaeon]|nr:FAD-dependent oxidoreductase [Thermoplasmata archaeon]
MLQSKKLVIVGGGAAALSAAMNARKENRDIQITMFTDEKVLPYSRCGLPFTIDGEIPDAKNLITQKDNFFKIIKVTTRLRCRVTGIEPGTNRITYIDETQKENSECYDTLILCTGAKPVLPKIPGVDKKGVFVLRTLEDAINISARMKQAKRAVVVGAGLIGLETAYALKKAGINVWVIELLDTVLKPVLDNDMAKLVKEKLEQHGIKVLLGKKVTGVEGGENVSKVIVEGEEFPCDVLVFATGVKPDVELAKNAGIELGEAGGIKVNERMETNKQGIYAAGDCAESIHRVTGKPVLSMLGTSAVRQGKVAGVNAAGGNAVYRGTLNATVTRLFDTEIGSVSITEWQAKAVGMDVVSVAVPWKTRAEYFPGASEIKLKLVFLKENLRLVGGQVVTKEGATGYVNLLSLAIDRGLSAGDLVHLDTCYSPPVADVWNPVCIAAELAVKKTAEKSF